MAGFLPASGRTGNRLEYLAHYILSKFGSTVPVLRQEDVGVDFFCTLGEGDAGGTTVDTSFAVQLKSGNNPKLEFGGKTAGKKNPKWRKYEIQWLFDPEFPLLFGVPHEKEKRLDIYSTSLAWFCAYRGKLPYRIELIPGKPGKSRKHIHPPGEDKLKHPRGTKTFDADCDGKIHPLNLGPPVVSCTIDDLEDPEILAQRKQLLRNLIEEDRKNVIYRELKLPYWTWTLETETNVSFNRAYSYAVGRTAASQDEILEALVPLEAIS